MTGEELVEDLSRPWRHGDHLDARDLVLDAPLVLDGRVLRSFDLSGARLKGGLSARGATFRGMGWLKRARVSGVCDLSGAVFRNDLRLDGLDCDRLVLTGARLEGVLSLDGAWIGELLAGDCICLANVSMAGTRVQGRLDLSGSELMGGLWARGAELGALEDADAYVEGRRVVF